MNDIPVIKNLYLERGVHMATTGYSYNPFQVITIGKQVDLPRGFNTFEIGDIQFWDKYIWGMPFQSIGKKAVIQYTWPVAGWHGGLERR